MCDEVTWLCCLNLTPEACKNVPKVHCSGLIKRSIIKKRNRIRCSRCKDTKKVYERIGLSTIAKPCPDCVTKVPRRVIG